MGGTGGVVRRGSAELLWLANASADDRSRTESLCRGDKDAELKARDTLFSKPRLCPCRQVVPAEFSQLQSVGAFAEDTDVQTLELDPESSQKVPRCVSVLLAITLQPAHQEEIRCK
jgi:hypothetical protein